MTPQRTDDDTLRLRMTYVIQNVFEVVLRATIEPQPETELHFEDPLTGAVNYVGEWHGALTLECSERQAAGWTSRLMPDGTRVSSEDVHDGLGELTNMIAGNLKPLLPPGVHLSMPAVITGAGHGLHLPGLRHCETVTLADALGPFRVSIIEFQDLSESSVMKCDRFRYAHGGIPGCADR